MHTMIPIPIRQLKASPTNPRKFFDESKLVALGQNMVQHGVLQPLLVRPFWCEGCKTQEQIAARRTRATTPGAPLRPDDLFEVVDGERRLRSAQLRNKEQPNAFEALPCDVRELTDTQVVEIQLITFIQKELLTPLEEAKGFQELLKLKTEKGEPLHTRETIAASVGRDETYVHRRLKLLALPDLAVTALDQGRIGAALAELIARIPGKEQRAEAAQAIISPSRQGGDPMTTREAEHFLKENFMQELKGAPFDTADPELDKKAGSCQACPHRTGNNKALFGDVKRGDVCTNPACYRQKCKLVFARASAAAVQADPNVKVLEEAEGAKLFAAHDGISLAYDTAYVDFSEKPPEGFVRHEVDRAKLPTWERLTVGRDIPKVVVQDRSGRMRTLVDRNLAIAAAKENGDDIFVSGLGGSRAPANSAEAAARKKAETEQKRALAVAVAASVAVRKALIGVSEETRTTLTLPVEIVEPLLDLAIAAAGADGVWFILKALDVKKPVNMTTEQAFRKALEQIKKPRERMAVAVELLYARGLRLSGVKKCEPFVAIAAGVSVDLKKLEAETIAGMKVKKGSETIDPKVLEQWVRAYVKGMPVEEIARSYKVPVADVQGALSGKVPAKKKTAKKGGGR